MYLPRRALFAALVTILAAFSAMSQDSASFAQQRFARGLQLYEAHDYGPALAEFRASQALYASPNSRFYAGRCLRELGRLDEAVFEIEHAVAEANDRIAGDPRYTGTRDAARTELAALEARVGRLTLNVSGIPASATVRVGERSIPAAGVGLALPVIPGTVQVVIEAPGFLTIRREVVMVAGQSSTLDVTLEPTPVEVASSSVPDSSPSPSPGPSPAPIVQPTSASPGPPLALAVTVLGVGVAGMGSFGIFGAMSLQRYSELSSTCGLMPCPQEQRARWEEGRNEQVIANVSLAVGIVGLAVGGALTIWNRSSRRVPVVLVGAGPAVVVGGAF